MICNVSICVYLWWTGPLREIRSRGLVYSVIHVACACGVIRRGSRGTRRVSDKWACLLESDARDYLRWFYVYIVPLMPHLPALLSALPLQ